MRRTASSQQRVRLAAARCCRWWRRPLALPSGASPRRCGARLTRTYLQPRFATRLRLHWGPAYKAYRSA